MIDELRTYFTLHKSVFDVRARHSGFSLCDMCTNLNE